MEGRGGGRGEGVEGKGWRGGVEGRGGKGWRGGGGGENSPEYKKSSG